MFRAMYNNGRTDTRKELVNEKCESMLFRNPMIEGVKWVERYALTVDKFWIKLPEYMRNTFVTFALVLMASTIKGDWIAIVVHMVKHFNGTSDSGSSPRLTDTIATANRTEKAEWDFLLEYLNLQGLPHYVIWAVIGSFLIYFSAGGFIHWYYYINKRDKPHEWKCQPEKFMAPELELHEVFVGSFSLLIMSCLSGILSCYAMNNGRLLTLYYRWDEYGWWWFFAQIIVIFLYQDYLTYWLHRIYHWPWLYKNFHKLHHTYKQPTAFSVTAIHPIEILHVQLTMLLPIFTIPTHWAAFYFVEIYTYVHGILNHSGVSIKSFWWQPWQPDTMFHDNHHQYFHVNFGFNIYLWDVLHGTYRRKDRVYSEDIFFGKGKSFDQVSKEQLLVDLAERKTENPKAYRENVNEYEVSDLEITKLVKNPKNR
ncbi:uncharacterized protein LOC131431370 [Malaya genurostris]|uniref:uncharacterized protein LOC131431370 n=1 Tax=Malaya genurostris TaxID=325434 RepID=UPI0026F3831D|nr:uncharacterized protein LOC131431370 [Malaya genurostris]